MPPVKVGGYSSVSVVNDNVVAAASFAIAEQNKRHPESAEIELSRICSASYQVVAGANYRMKLELVDGREAEAIVWWQSWRAPDPYQLTSWHWKNSPDLFDSNCRQDQQL